jgi:alpha-beta hydrolase superfamily lysophospholipase
MLDGTISDFMPNIADADAYTTFDHVFSKTVRALSAVVGLRKITQPFWGRWLASEVDPGTIFEFLDRVGTIDNWATTAEGVVARKQEAFDDSRPGLSPDQTIRGLRELSYLGHMGQWGCLPITDQRRRLYTLARDYYVEAETLAFGDRYCRIDVDWDGAKLPGNLHSHTTPAPLVIIVHGIDGCKEEHLATELTLHAAGFAVLTLDGPGQGESLLLRGKVWTPEFHRAISAGIDAVAETADTSRVGVLGISIGAMWSLQAAAHDARIRAVFDLGAPLHTRKFPSLPYLIKTRLCQVTGARTRDEVALVLAQNNIEDVALLNRIAAHVRIVHGARDRVVATADKAWLLARFKEAGHDREASLRVIEGGDHCCTGHFDSVRADASDFFTRTLQPV